jgi:membrane protein DedA with SNARE-associated domain
MAGIAQMPYPQFLLCNLGGATLWGTIMVTASFFLGRLIPLHQLVSWAARFGIIALMAVVASIVAMIWLESQKAKLEMKK